MEYLYIYFYLVLTNILVTLVAMSFLLVSYLHLKKTSTNQFKNVQTYLNGLEKIPKIGRLAHYLLPFYGVFLSLYLVYLYFFVHEDTIIPRYRFQFVEEDLNKVRIFKRKIKWKNYYYH